VGDIDDQFGGLMMWYNAFTSWLLRSPLHGLLSKSFMLITVSGRKSGRKYTTPVNYARDGDTLWVTSLRQRTWWRNLKGGAPVSVLVARRALKGRGEAIVDEKAVADSLLAYFQKFPQYARHFRVTLDPAGQPVREDCTRAAKERVMVRITLEATQG
jgi:deazaflavin-dependent oxidoreductase (nitroreductase family)